ncbi:hypothetical protein DXG01_003428 [Tephrocybe rancida]|nr:hypothetical protein DXG01_003428 [Tephrocybe rancida]
MCCFRKQHSGFKRKGMIVKEKSPLHQLDEAHNIKECSINMAKAAFELKGSYRHTPMQHTCFWNNEILTPIQKIGMVGPGKPVFKKLRILLDRMMLQRTKLQKADDLGLLPRTVYERKDYFSPEEKDLYLLLYTNAKRQFSTYVDQGTVLNTSRDYNR